MTNQNFRVNVSIDASAARRALRNLEQEFRDMRLDFGDLDRAARDFRELSTSVKTLSDAFSKMERTFRSFDNALDRQRRVVQNVASAFDRLERETRDARGGLRDLADTTQRLGSGLNSIVNAIQRYAIAANKLEKGTPRQITHLTRDLRQLDRALRDTDFPLNQMADELGQLSRAAGALDRTFERLSRTERTLNFESLARGIERLRRSMREADGTTGSWIRELRDLADAIRAVERAEASMNRRARRNVGPGGRQANRSQGVPVGFAGVGGALGFLGVGGAGLQFAGAAAGIALFANLAQGIATAGRALFEFTSQTITLGAEFDLLIRRANILAGGGALDELTRVALEEGKRTIFTTNEAAEALGELARAGFDTRESMAALPGVLDLAASDSLALADATLIVARQTRAFGLEAADAQRVADVFAQSAAASAASTAELAQAMKFAGPVAAQLGIPIEEVAAATSVLADQGQVAGLAGRALRFAIGALTGPTLTQQAAFDRLNLSTTDADGNFRGLYDITQQLAAAQKNAGTQTEFVGNVFDAFGKNAAPRILALVNQVDLFGERITDNFGAFGRAAEIANEQLAGLEGALERLRGEIEGQQIEVFDRTGFEEALAGLVQDTETAIPTVFQNLVDPLFNELAVGITRLRSETFPQVVDATEEVGESVSDVLGNVFAFITDNDDDIIASIQGVVTAVEGIVNIFLGLGEVALPIIGAISASFSALPDAISSSLTGAAAGGLVGLLFGPGGALVGAGVGAIAGLIGQQFSEATVPQQVAEYGVGVGQSLNDAIAQGMDIGQAINQALAETETPEGFDQILSASDLQRQREELGELLGDLESVRINLASLNLLDRGDFSGLTGSLTTDAQSLEEVEATIGRLQTRLGDLGFDVDTSSLQQFSQELTGIISDVDDQLEFTTGTLANLLNTPTIRNAVNEQIRQAEEIRARLARAGDPLQFAFEIERDPATILQGITDGIDDFPALTRNGVAVPVEEAGRIVQESLEKFGADVEQGAVRAIQQVDQITFDFITAIEGFRTFVQSVDFGGSFFGEIPSLDIVPDTLLQFDWTELLAPTDADGAEIAQSVGQVRQVLLDAVKEIDSPELQGEINATVRGILNDGDLSLADQALLGAFVVDQAFLAEQAEEFADAVEGIFERAREIVDSAFIRPDGGIVGTADLIEAGAFDTLKLDAEAASTVLLDLVSSGQTALAQFAATDEQVLGAIVSNAERLADAEGRIAELDLEIEQEVFFRANEGSILEVTQTITEDMVAAAEGLSTELGEVDVTSGLTDQLPAIPQAMRDQIQESIDAATGVDGFNTGSPSRVMTALGRDVVAGLQIGWDSGFGSFRSNVLGDIAALVAAIKSAFSNLTLSPIQAPRVTSSTSADRPNFHFGGMVPGLGELDARLLGGEFVLSRPTVRALNNMGMNLEVLNRDPRAYVDRSPAAMMTASYDNSRTTTISHEHHWTVPAGTNLNERKIRREFEKTIIGKVRSGM